MLIGNREDDISGGQDEYVIARATRGLGIGTRLISLAGAVWLARRLGRAVIVDWLGSAYLEDPSLNYFTEIFEPVPSIAGVPILYASPETDYRSDPDLVKLHASECRALLAANSAIPRYLVSGGVLTLDDLDPLGDAAGHQGFLHDFYGHIVPSDHIARELDAWYEEHLRGHFVVGVNVSSGNGYFGIGKRGTGRVDVRSLENERRLLRRIERARKHATRGLSRADRARVKVFYATDSTAMAELLGRLPGSLTRRTVFPPPGVGRRFSAYDEQDGHSDRAAALDTIVDMMLLARCQALVRNESMFSYYALVSSGYFDGRVYDLEGNAENVEALRRRVRGKGRILKQAATSRQPVG